ncbi:hypothetical protein ACFX2I_002783 [Malus domestica]
MAAEEHVAVEDTMLTYKVAQSQSTTQSTTQNNNPLPASPPLDKECESMDSTNSDREQATPNHSCLNS